MINLLLRAGTQKDKTLFCQENYTFIDRYECLP